MGRAPDLHVRSKYLLWMHRPKRPALLVLLITPGSKIELPRMVANRYDGVVRWYIYDNDSEAVEALKKLKNSVAIALGHTVPPSPSDARHFLESLIKTMDSVKPASITVSCTMGISRSPAVAAFIAELYRDVRMSKRIRNKYPAYNTTIYALLKKVAVQCGWMEQVQFPHQRVAQADNAGLTLTTSNQMAGDNDGSEKAEVPVVLHKQDAQNGNGQTGDDPGSTGAESKHSRANRI